MHLLLRRKQSPRTEPLSQPGPEGGQHSHTYVLPKDLSEGNRLDFQHHLLHTIIGRNFVAPIDEHPQAILDVATGTGRWAKEMAHTFPNARVIGLDMAEPTETSHPPANYTFVQGNLFAGLPFPDGFFNFVYQRFLVLALPAKQWPFILAELGRVTRPGGFVELVEGGGAFHHAGPAIKQLQHWWDEASKAHGIDVALMAQLPSLLKQAGLQQIASQTYRVPIGESGGRVGKMLQQDILASLPGIKPFLCKYAEVSEKEFDDLVSVLPNEWRTYKTQYDYYVAYGQKGMYDVYK